MMRCVVGCVRVFSPVCCLFRGGREACEGVRGPGLVLAACRPLRQVGVFTTYKYVAIVVVGGGAHVVVVVVVVNGDCDYSYTSSYNQECGWRN